ncbi:MAG: hypothetical protein J6J17_02160 [Bacilli bacterium]|nr:hypothetical protein [Bacilli bacterium]
MKFNGKKHLNSNMYKKIRIKEKNTEVIVSAIPDERFKNVETLKLSIMCITDFIKDMNEEDKVKEITEYFLRNNTICGLIDDKNGIIVNSVSGRQLVISLSCKYRGILNLIYEKYQNDRLKFLSETNIDTIHITEIYLNKVYRIITHASIYQVVNIDNKDVIHLNLFSDKAEEIAKFDLNFIDNYIRNFINNSPSFIWSICNSYASTYFIFDLNKKIYLPYDLYEKYEQEVIKHNHFIENEDKKQLSLNLERESI